MTAAQDAGMRRCCGLLALQRAASLSSRRSLVILFRFFTSFVYFLVIRLSFSSFCFPSVDCGCVASLPGLKLLFLWKIGFRGGGDLLDRIDKIDGINKIVGSPRGERLLCDRAVAFRHCDASAP